MNETVNSLINDSQPILGLTKSLFQFNDIDLLSLQNNPTGFLIKNGNELSLDNTILEEYVSEIIDGWTIIDKRYWNKRVLFNLFIQGSNHNDLIAKIQQLKRDLNEKNGSLYITRAWVSYMYTATCSSIVFPDPKTTEDFLDDVQISFIITSPHGSIEEPEVIQLTETTDFEKIVNNTWTYKSYPKVILIGRVWASITDVTIELKKVWEVTWNDVFIDQAIGSWDVLIADYNEKVVTINWAEIPFTGFLTPLQTGNNVFDFTFSGTVDLDVYIIYNKVFL